MLSSHNDDERPWVVYVSTFPPRECGIATFTQDLMNAFDEQYFPKEESKVIPINLNKKIKYSYDRGRVLETIVQGNLEDYLRVARTLNSMEKVAVVNIQHEFGIFGGEYGSYIVNFMKELTKPVVLTLHTVLPSPNPTLKSTVESLAEHASTIVVMTQTSLNILKSDYRVNVEKIIVIPHGIHSRPFKANTGTADCKNSSKQITLSTFGLLSKGKGIEYGIEALPPVIKKYPNVVYHIIGATHPVVQAHEGEAYRKSLINKVEELGLQKNVVFHNKYYKLPEILSFLDSTDIYLSLSQEPNQAVSGTFSYALGAGRPVISTSFAQAKEEINPGNGLLVGFKNSEEISSAILKLLDDREKLQEMGIRSYFRTRNKTWQNVALSYMREYIKLAPQLALIEKNLPKINLRHFTDLTDSFGMLQFAKLTTPDPNSGYTTDDNARALVAMVNHLEIFRNAKVLPLIKIFLKYIDFASEESGKFYNYVNYDRTIPLEKNTLEDNDDTWSRTMLALAVTASSKHLSTSLRKKAVRLFKKGSRNSPAKHHRRANAFYAKALVEWMKYDPSGEIKNQLTECCDNLVSLYKEHTTQNWQWFENSLTYSNSVMPEALILAYQITKKTEYLEIAKESMDFLIIYSFDGEMCVPIGRNGWFQKGGEKQIHDQQPEEVATLVQSLKVFYEITGDHKYKKLMNIAFSWFTGNNTLHQVVYDQVTGGCFDGVGKDEVNLNQGAESTVMYLLARLKMEEGVHPSSDTKSIFQKIQSYFK